MYFIFNLMIHLLAMNNEEKFDKKCLLTMSYFNNKLNISYHLNHLDFTHVNQNIYHFNLLI